MTAVFWAYNTSLILLALMMGVSLAQEEPVYFRLLGDLYALDFSGSIARTFITGSLALLPIVGFYYLRAMRKEVIDQTKAHYRASS
jgi:hypothetical protein